MSHFLLGGYPNPDPHCISPEEEQKLESEDLCPHCGGTGFQGDDPCGFCAAGGYMEMVAAIDGDDECTAGVVSGPYCTQCNDTEQVTDTNGVVWPCAWCA